VNSIPVGNQEKNSNLVKTQRLFYDVLLSAAYKTPFNQNAWSSKVLFRHAQLHIQCKFLIPRHINPNVVL